MLVDEQESRRDAAVSAPGTEPRLGIVAPGATTAATATAVDSHVVVQAATAVAGKRAGGERKRSAEPEAGSSGITGSNLDGHQAHQSQAANAIARAPAAGTELTSGSRQPLGELRAWEGDGSSNNSNNNNNNGGSRGGRAPCGNRDFVLTEERMAAVRCYFREGDPLVIRANLTKLAEGTLKRLAVGDTVSVARR